MTHSMPPASPLAASRPEGETRPAQNGQRAPRLPHERDQSATDQQAQQLSPTHNIGQRAHDDAQGPPKDTGRRKVLDKVYQDRVKSSPPGS